MTTLLRINASLRTEDSLTRLLGDHFEAIWRQAHPDGQVIQHCLARNPLPHLDAETLAAFDNQQHHPRIAPLLADWERADEIVIGSPLYNLGVPSSLKAYFDHIVISGISFEYADGQYRGRLQNRPTTLIIARGGATTPGLSDDYQQGWLTSILQFIGIRDLRNISVDATSTPDEKLEEKLTKARMRILLQHFPEARREWIGEFSADDQAAITRLSQQQAQSIVTGSATAYASLCADDIQLLLPGYDVVQGKEAFTQFETNVFAHTQFRCFRKFPLRVERSGNLAIETGEQEVATCHNSESGGIFASRQKYTHIMRKTPAGWHFAILMSNPS